MTDIEQKALALVNEVVEERHPGKATVSFSRRNMSDEALCRAIEQHEQFKREVSDAVEAFFEASGFDATKGLIRFILPKPVDPLVEAVGDALEAQGMGRPKHTTPEITEHLRAALAKRGGKIVWENEP